MSKPKLVLIDGYHTIFRAFYAIRELQTSRGEPVNAVFGFLQILRKLLKDERPEYVGVALDVSDQTFRTEKFADYKANRAPMPDELRPQIPYIRRAIEGFRIPMIELDRYEADDVMGTLARKGAAAGLDVILVSADKDLMQLVGDGVSMYHTGRAKYYDAAAVEAEWGVPPPRVADVLALMGDTVDNVPGVPGIGEKGAKQLVAEYGTVEQMVDRASEMTRKAYREGLTTYREQALLSKELTTIHTDLPIELELDGLRAGEPDVERLRALYGELEFRRLAEELGESAPRPVEAAAAEIDEVTEAAELERRFAALGGEVRVVLVPGESPVAAAFGGVEGAFVVDLRSEPLRTGVGGGLAALAARPEVELVGHDLKEALRLVRRGARACCRLFDLMLASYLLRTSSHGHPLEEIALDRLAVQPRGLKEAGFDRGQSPPPGDPRLRALAAERLALVARLAENLRPELEAGPAAAVYRDIERPLLPVLLAMEETGVRLDVAFLADLSKEMAAEIEALETSIYELAGERFNIGSPQQLGTVLFEKLGLPVLRRTKKTKSWSTDAETLEELAARGHELPQRLLRWRETTKLKGTYVDALPTLVAADGRIHTRFQQAVAATGRISSWNPNLQNIPIRTEQGSRIRRAFRAEDGFRLVVADYSQIELRVLAHIAREPAMIEAFSTGEDIHRSTAAAVLGVAPELVTPDQRRAAKTVNFGLLYGMSAFGLATRLGIAPKEAEKFIAAYFDRYRGVRAYMDETVAMAEREGKVETLWGRVRLLPEIRSDNRVIRENARRVAINSRIQGSAADLLKRAMIAVDRRLAGEHPRSRLLLTVHDELVLEAPAADATAVGELVRREMESAAELAVPLVVDVGIGPTWFDAKA